jgi:SAM-dependent methyltransferase
MGQDSSRPEFWDTRYRGGVTPWDAAGVPAQLLTWLRNQLPGTVLVPGCGSGYEVAAFAGHGHEVMAIEFSDAAIEAARAHLGPLAHLVRKADYFSLDAGPFDLVYERAFLCALPRALWPQWAARLAELVRPGGALAGFFYLDDNERGPPFGTSMAQLEALLSGAFRLEQDRAIPPDQSIAVFKGKERWQRWVRKL